MQSDQPETGLKSNPTQKCRMAITAPIDRGHAFDVEAPFNEVFALLSDVLASAGH